MTTKRRDLNFAKGNVRNVLAPHINSIIQVTYRTGEGRKTITDDFLISKLNEESVWLDRTIYNHSLGEIEPSGYPFLIPLERVHVIVTGKEVIFPAKNAKKTAQQRSSVTTDEVEGD